MATRAFHDAMARIRAGKLRRDMTVFELAVYRIASAPVPGLEVIRARKLAADAMHSVAADHRCASQALALGMRDAARAAREDAAKKSADIAQVFAACDSYDPERVLGPS